MSLFYQRFSKMHTLQWLSILLVAPHGVYLIAFGILTKFTTPVSRTVAQMSEVWGVPVLVIELLFIVAGAGILIRRHVATVWLAYFVQISYLVVLSWTVIQNDLSLTAIVQSSVTTLSMIIMLDLASGIETEKRHGIFTTNN